MKSFTDERVENYLYAMLPPRDATLQEMERQAKERDIPIVGPAVGRMFYQYARLINAKTVFEMGSAIGYSTIWWARAVGEGGKVHYTDGSRKNADEAASLFSAGRCRRPHRDSYRRRAGAAVGAQRAVRRPLLRHRQT